MHLKSFEAVVGFKSDKFQFFTTTLLILVISFALLSSIGKPKSMPIRILALGTPLAFIIVELLFIGRINPIFWLDTAIEAVVFIVLLILFAREGIRENPH